MKTGSISYKKFLRKPLHLPKKKTVTLDDMILLLLYVIKDKPIIHRTVLFKQIFLLYKEILPSLITERYKNIKIVDHEFYPYKYGPYSDKLSKSLTNLYEQGFIDVKGRAKGKLEKFLLTKRGETYFKKFVKPEFQEFMEELEKILKIKRIQWDQWSRDGILRYVYQNYPEYTTKSKLKNKYRRIKWGEIFQE